MAMELSTMDGAGVSAAARSLAVLPGGSNGEFGLPEDLTTVIERGEGCRLWDDQGREWLDFSMGWGSALVGHARAEVVEAVRARASLGTNFSYPSMEAVRLAEELVRLSPACERVRFCASGTEATMYCLRLARAFTGRDLVLKFEGAYHGSNDEGVTSLFPSGSTPFPAPEPSSAGICASRTVIAPYNDAETTGRIIGEHADRLGAVIVEPLQRCLPPSAGFLESLRAACDRHAVVLVFDEVVTGFRLAYNGAQGYYGVVPDLVAYGKALGGGMPIGAFGGREEIMDLVREDGIGTPRYVWTASTLGGNPVSAAAANVALGVLRGGGVYERLHGSGRRFREILARALRDTGHAGQVLGDGPLGQIAFTDAPVHDYRSSARADRAKARAMMLGLFRLGVFVNPMGTKLYLSLAHDDAAMEEFGRRLRAVLAGI
jgi:glutamate-1-semialdehyde 2,1-aminomutase